MSGTSVHVLLVDGPRRGETMWIPEDVAQRGILRLTLPDWRGYMEYQQLFVDVPGSPGMSVTEDGTRRYGCTGVYN